MKRAASILIILHALLIGAHGTVPFPLQLRDAEPSVPVRTTGVGADAEDDVQDVIAMQTAMTDDKTASPPLADDLAFFVRQRYLELGYPEAKVRWEVAGAEVVLEVEEGPRYTVGQIVFDGNTAQDEEALTGYLLRPTREKLGRTDRKVPFVEADLRAGSEQVQRFIRGQGYLRATVSDLAFTKHPETATVDIRARVIEGDLYTIGAITFSGDFAGEEKAVRKQIAKLTGQPFNEVVIENKRAAIAGIYQEAGHYQALVTARADATSRRVRIVPVHFHIAPGPLFRIVRVETVPGFSKGAQRLIRSSFMPAVGKIYVPADLEVMHRRVLDSDVFSRLDVTPRPHADGTLTLELSGEEALRKRLSAYAGFETFLGPIIGAEYREVNFLDTGDALRLKAEITGKGFNGAIQVIDPAIFNSSFSLDAELSTENIAVFDYERRTTKARTTLSRHWNRNVFTSLFAEGSLNNSSSENLTPAELGPEDYRLATVGASLVLDYRNSPVLPTKGWTAGFSIADAFASGTEVGYLRSDVYFSFYQPITRKLRTAFSARTSVVKSDSGVEGVPIDLRLFNGGANSVRSFAEREMGAKSRSGTPLGGTLANVFTAELSYEVAPNLELALFGDAGSLSPTDTDPFRAPGGLRYAVGLGLRYKLPFGPVRIDYGINPSREEGEKLGALHVTFGFAF